MLVWRKWRQCRTDSGYGVLNSADLTHIGLPQLVVNTTGYQNLLLQDGKNFSAISAVSASLTAVRRVLTLSGWMTAIGWQVYCASVAFLVGTIIQGLIALNDPNYIWHNWHGTLLAIACIVFSIIFNTVLASRLPLIEGLVLILHILGFFAIIIPLWVMAPRAPADVALLTFTNNGGWPTTGLSSMIGLIAPVAVLIGYDCSVHMCKFSTLCRYGILTRF